MNHGEENITYDHMTHILAALALIPALLLPLYLILPPSLLNHVLHLLLQLSLFLDLGSQFQLQSLSSSPPPPPPSLPGLSPPEPAAALIVLDWVYEFCNFEDSFGLISLAQTQITWVNSYLLHILKSLAWT